MAIPYKTIHSGKANSNVTSVTVDIGSPAVGDIVVVSINLGPDKTLTEDGGLGLWTFLAKRKQGTEIHQYWRRIAGGESNPTFSFSGSATKVVASAVLISGCPASASPFAATATGGAAATYFDCPTVDTTGSDDCLIVTTVGGDRTGKPSLFSPEAEPLYYYENNNGDRSIYACAFTQQAGGVTPTITIRQSRETERYSVITFAIKDGGFGQVRGQTLPDSSIATVIHNMNGEGAGAFSGELGASTDRAADPTPVFNSAFPDDLAVPVYEGLTHSNVPFYLAELARFSGLDLSGGEYDSTQLLCFKLASSQDLSSKIISFMAKARSNNVHTYETGGYYFGFISGDLTNGDGHIWKFAASDTVVRPDIAIFPYSLNTANTPFHTDSAGTGSAGLNDVNYIVLGIKGTSGTDVFFGMLMALGTAKMTGGTSTLPCSFRDAARILTKNGLRTVQSQGFQAKDQFYVSQSVQVGSGVSDTPVFWVSLNQSVEYAGQYDESGFFVHSNTNAGDFRLSTYGGSGDTIDWRGTTVNMANQHEFGVNSSSSTSGSYLWTGLVLLNANLYNFPDLGAGNEYDGITFSACSELTYGAGAEFPNCTFDSTVADGGGVAAYSFTTQAQLSNLAGASFTNNTAVPALRLTGDSGDLTLPDNMTFSGNTYDLEYTGDTDFDLTVSASSNTFDALKINETGLGTITVVAPVNTLSINSDTAASLIRYFEDDSQTVVDSTTGVTLDYDYPDTDVIDIEILKQSYVPVNRQNVTPYNGDYDVIMDFDEAYNSAHGLTITSEYDLDRDTKVLTINSDQEALDVRSSLADVIRTNSSYYNTPLLMVAIPGLTRIDLTDGMTITSMATWKGAGMEKFDAADSSNPTEKWVSIKSVGDITGSTAHYRQTSSGASSAVTLTSNVVNEAFQYWSDPNHDGSTDDGYDYSDYLVIKAFLAGSKQARVDVVDSSGAAALKSNLYTVALANVSHDYAGTDPGIIADLTLVAGGVVGGKTFAYKWVDGGTNSGTDIADQLNWSASNDPAGTIPGGLGLTWFDLADMVIYNATAVETERCFLEGATPTYKGFYVERGGADHPDFTRFQADDGTYYVVPVPDTSITITSDQAGSLIQIFESGTQTIIDSTTGTSLEYIFSTPDTVDIVVQKAGFIPQRQTGVELVDSSFSVPIALVADPVYQAGHGLVYTTDFSYARATSLLTLGTRATVRELWSALIDAFIAETTLRNTQFKFQMNGPASMFFIDDAEFNNSTSWDNVYAGGFKYIDSADVSVAEWCAVTSNGDAAGFTGEYQQVAGSGTTDARATGAFAQVIQLYGDASHGNFDYRDYLVLKFQPNPYEESRIDVLDTFGISTLEPIEYIVAMEPELLDIAAGDPAISITVVDHTGAPLVVGGKSFDFEIQDNGTNSGEDIEREWNYNKSLDAVYQGKDPFNWPDTVVRDGAASATIYGPVEGLAGLHGWYVSRAAADHPDFSKFQSNDGTYYTPAVTVSLSAPNLLAGSRVRLYNLTQDAEIENVQTVSAGYSKSLTTPGDYDSGDTIVLLATYQSGGVAKRVFRGTAVVTTANVTFTDSQADWDNPGPNTLGIDGSLVSECQTDYVEMQVEVDDSDNTTFKSRIAAFIVDSLTTEEGIRSWVGLSGNPVITYSTNSAVTIDTSVIDLEIINVKAASKLVVKDSFEFDWSDGIDRVDAVLGSSVIWIAPDRVLLEETGVSGLTPSESAQLSLISTVDINVDQVLVDLAVVDSNVDLILADTNELQTNQGNWLTATGFSTHNPSDVYAEFTSGSNEDAFKADVSGLSTFNPTTDVVARVTLVDTTTVNTDMRGTDGANTIAPFNPTTATLEGAETYDEAFRLMRASLAGAVSRSGDTFTFLSKDGLTSRIISETDTDGQRITVITDGS